jgi:hypothetical protein
MPGRSSGITAIRLAAPLMLVTGCGSWEKLTYHGAAQ